MNFSLVNRRWAQASQPDRLCTSDSPSLLRFLSEMHSQIRGVWLIRKMTFFLIDSVSFGAGENVPMCVADIKINGIPVEVLEPGKKTQSSVPSC